METGCGYHDNGGDPGGVLRCYRWVCLQGLPFTEEAIGQGRDLPREELVFKPSCVVSGQFWPLAGLCTPLCGTVVVINLSRPFMSKFNKWHIL